MSEIIVGVERSEPHQTPHEGRPSWRPVVGDRPPRAPCAQAQRLGASMIVAGNQRVQRAARVLGSITGELAKQAPCSLLIVEATGARS
jgi:nucleotide-binding universal stress UspA family protein